MGRRSSEPNPDAELSRQRPARAFVVDILQAFLDEPIHVRQPTRVTQLNLSHQLDGADADDNGHVEITDAVVIISDLFLGTSAIASPFPEDGVDPTPDSSQ